MTIWFMDGFDHYTEDTWGTPGAAISFVDVLKKWTSTGATTAAELALSEFYARQQPGAGLLLGNNKALDKTRPGVATTNFILGFAFMLTTATASTNTMCAVLDGTTEQVSVRFDNAGHVQVHRAGTTLATSTNVVSANTWYWIEFKGIVHNSTGAYEVRINGTSTGWIPAATGADTTATANNSYTGVRLNSAGANIRFDDFYAGDASSDFLGNQVICTLRPSGAGNYAQWTPNYGINFGNVNEIYPDGDSSFNQSATANQIDTFEFQNIPFISGTISAIQHVLYAKQDAGAARQIAPLQRSGGVDYTGTVFNLSASYQYLLDLKQLDPATAAGYVIADFNSSEFGYKLIS